MVTAEYISYGIVSFAAIAVIYVIYWSIRYRSVITITNYKNDNGDISSSHSDMSSCYDTESQTSDKIFFDQKDEKTDASIEDICSTVLCSPFPTSIADHD